MSTSREQTCQYGGVCNMEDIVTVSSYNLAFCEPNSHIHPGIQFRVRTDNLSPLEHERCICHFVKWQIHPFISKGTNYIYNDNII